MSFLAGLRPDAICLGELPPDVAGVETEYSSTRASKGLVTMTPYPSDAFLGYLAAVAGKINFEVIKRTFHLVLRKEK